MIESFLELSKYLVMKLTSYPGHLSFLMSGNGEGVLFVPWACPISGGVKCPRGRSGFRGCLGLAVVFVWGGARREGFDFYFSGVFF